MRMHQPGPGSQWVDLEQTVVNLLAGVEARYTQSHEVFDQAFDLFIGKELSNHDKAIARKGVEIEVGNRQGNGHGVAISLRQVYAPPMLTERFDRAVSYVRIVHADHLRKGTDRPYLCHLLQVAGLALELGANEDQTIAALLHDTPEDRGGEPRLKDIEAQFGEAVALIVRENSDSLAESPEEKAKWEDRKTHYLAEIPHKSAGACLVSICDKIHNARSLLSDQMAFGDGHWSRFKRGKADTIAHFRALVDAFARRAERFPELLDRPVAELERAVVALEGA